MGGPRQLALAGELGSYMRLIKCFMTYTLTLVTLIPPHGIRRSTLTSTLLFLKEVARMPEGEVARYV